MIRLIKPKDKINFQDYCNRYGENLFTDCSFRALDKEFRAIIKYNKYCIISEENNFIGGLLLIEVINNEYHIKTTYKNSKVLDNLLSILNWNIQKDLTFRLNDYRVVSILKKHFFRFKGKIDNDYVYFRKYFKKVKK